MNIKKYLSCHYLENLHPKGSGTRISNPVKIVCPFLGRKFHQLHPAARGSRNSSIMGDALKKLDSINPWFPLKRYQETMLLTSFLKPIKKPTSLRVVILDNKELEWSFTTVDCQPLHPNKFDTVHGKPHTRFFRVKFFGALKCPFFKSSCNLLNGRSWHK